MKLHKGRLTKIGTVQNTLADISEEMESTVGLFVSRPTVGRLFSFFVDGGSDELIQTSTVVSCTTDDEPGAFVTKNSVYRLEDFGELDA